MNVSVHTNINLGVNLHGLDWHKAGIAPELLANMKTGMISWKYSTRQKHENGQVSLHQC